MLYGNLVYLLIYLLVNLVYSKYLVDYFHVVFCCSFLRQLLVLSSLVVWLAHYLLYQFAFLGNK